MNDKLAQALHYLIHLAQDRRWPLGAVKLAKSIVLSEAASLGHRHRPLTGVRIVKAPRGPIPDKYEEHLQWLESKGLIRISEGNQLYEPTSYESLSPPLMSGFDAQELEIMAEIGEICCKKYTAADLSDLTHDDIWKMTDMGEKIPLATYLPSMIIPSTPEQLEESRQELMAMGYVFKN